MSGENRANSPGYYADLVRRAAPNLKRMPDQTWLQCLDAEQDALLDAFPHLQGLAAAEFAVGLWRWCLERGRFSQGISMLLESQATHGDVPLDLKTEACYAMGFLFLRMNRYAGAERYLNLAAQLAEMPQSKGDPALIKHVQGTLLRTMGRLDESKAAHELSLQWWSEAEDVWGMATAHMGLGVLMWAQQRLALAQTHLRKSAKLYQQVNDKRNAAKVLINLANVANALGNHPQAVKGYRQALYLQQKLGERQDRGHTLNNLGLVQARLGDFAEAKKSLQESIGLLNEIGQMQGLLVSIATLAEVAQIQGDHRQCVLLYGAFENLSKQFDMVLPPADQLEIIQNLTEMRVLLGPTAYGIFWKRGIRMTLEDVLKIVLG